MRTKHKWSPIAAREREIAADASCEPRLGFRVTDQGEDVTIDVLGVVGDPWDGLTAATLVPEIAKAKGRALNVRLNSPGGLVFDAVAVATMLQEHDAPVRADIIGEAASAATIISSAADTVRIAAAGEFMIHRSSIGLLAFGNEDTLGQAIDDLQQLRNRLRGIDSELVEIYAERTGKPSDEIREMLVGPAGDGTYLTGREAVEQGFADELIGQPSTKASDLAAQERSRALALARARLTTVGAK